MSKKVMKLIDPRSGLMECKVCGSRHVANLATGGRYVRGSWQCLRGCQVITAAVEAVDAKPRAVRALLV